MATNSAPAWANAPAVMADGRGPSGLVRKVYVRQGATWYALASRGYLAAPGYSYAAMAARNPAPTAAPAVKPRPATTWVHPDYR